MRVLHVVKTADGGGWAADQAAELTRLGVEVHVVLPTVTGKNVERWINAGAILHIAPTDLPVAAPWSIPAAARRLRQVVSSIRPDVIHSHFFASTILLRLGLGADASAPRLFQVPGPLHLEHRIWRSLDLQTAGARDYWIPSSRCILGHYRRAGVAADRLFLSYYGAPIVAVAPNRGVLRRRYGIPADALVVGNANLIYPPKWFLGQRIGLKAHEDVIDALGLVLARRPGVTGVLIGGPLTGSHPYERALRARALQVGRGRILMPGLVEAADLREMWPDFDVAVHVPLSENCGGVGDSLLAGVPTIAGRVGGLPEVVVDGVTGKLVAIRNPEEMAQAILTVLDDRDTYRKMARLGGALMRTMFDVRRTASEIFGIYRRLVEGGPRPPAFDSVAHLRQISAPVAEEETSRQYA